MSSLDLPLPRPCGRFTLVRRLGMGGMGVVYVARDDRLDRDIAIKMIAGLSDDAAVKRFWREARAAAAVSHPNVCRVYEVDEGPEGIYLAMELLEGESLEERLTRGACTPPEAIRIAVETLAALNALHERGLVHRDVKPANVFLTPHGAKLLDFGLARSANAETLLLDGMPAADVTQPGAILGTPRYMAPEQARGEAVDGRTDVYATGAVLFEMLAGRPPFVGNNVFDVLYAVLHEHPPALQGPPVVVAIDRVIRRALDKDPGARYAGASAMAKELESIPRGDSTVSSAVPVRALMRVVVPPLRMVRPDADAAFLSFGLAEAVSGSLAGLGDMVVRSTGMASKWTDSALDPRRLAAEADVDLIIVGSLLRVDDQLRATVQLVEAGSGTVLGAASVRGTMSDVFGLEDELTRATLGLLAPHRPGMAASDAGQPVRDIPANAQAFEQFLRGIEHARELVQLPAARVCFERALEEDPTFAPAWAGLGRCHRVIGKYIEDREANELRAEEAFRRALALSPDLPMAHRFLTHLEAEHGHADAAIGRLLAHAKVNRNDPQLFAGLVHACRYAGLNKASLAAHEEARRLDPTVETGIGYTLLFAGQHDRLASLAGKGVDGENTPLLHYLLMTERGREAADLLDQMGVDRMPPGFRLTVDAVRAAALGARDDAVIALERAVAAHADPEAIFIFGMIASKIGLRDRALELLGQAVRGGFSPVWALEHLESLDTVRGAEEFRALQELAEQRRLVAQAVFVRGGGAALLGV